VFYDPTNGTTTQAVWEEDGTCTVTVFNGEGTGADQAGDPTIYYGVNPPDLSAAEDKLGVPMDPPAEPSSGDPNGQD
jgi:hypothetical protein